RRTHVSHSGSGSGWRRVRDRNRPVSGSRGPVALTGLAISAHRTRAPAWGRRGATMVWLATSGIRVMSGGVGEWMSSTLLAGRAARRWRLAGAGAGRPLGGRPGMAEAWGVGGASGSVGVSGPVGWGGRVDAQRSPGRVWAVAARVPGVASLAYGAVGVVGMDQ